MSLIDLLILNFAVGAPFGAIYYFNNRKSHSAPKLFLFTTTAVMFWVIYAFKLLARNRNEKIFALTSLHENPIHASVKNGEFLKIQKEIEKLIIKSKSNVSIYEFREVAERYIGLALANQVPNRITGDRDSRNGVLVFSRAGNIEIAAACITRRANDLLGFHRIRARQDFLDFVNVLNLPENQLSVMDSLCDEFILILENWEPHFESSSNGSNSQVALVTAYRNRQEHLLWKTKLSSPINENHQTHVST